MGDLASDGKTPWFPKIWETINKIKHILSYLRQVYRRNYLHEGVTNQKADYLINKTSWKHLLHPWSATYLDTWMARHFAGYAGSSITSVFL